MPVQALYANISLLEHSCINNASKHFDGDFRQGSEELIYNIYEGLKGFWSNFQHYFYFYFFPIFLEDFLLLWGGLWNTTYTLYSIYRSGVDPVHYIRNRILKCALIWIRIRASFKNLKKIYKNIGMWKKFWIRPIGVESFFLLLTLWIRISFWIVDPIGMRINNTAFSAPSFLDVNKSSFYY